MSCDWLEIWPNCWLAGMIACRFLNYFPVYRTKLANVWGETNHSTFCVQTHECSQSCCVTASRQSQLKIPMPCTCSPYLLFSKSYLFSIKSICVFVMFKWYILSARLLYILHVKRWNVKTDTKVVRFMSGFFKDHGSIETSFWAALWGVKDWIV